MLHLRKHLDLGELGQRLREAAKADATLLDDVIEGACRRLMLLGHSTKTAHLRTLIESEAWTDAALILVEIELPWWQLRRLAYDDGEWYCALSRERELPEWLDQSIEARHADLPLAILTAFIEARRANSPESRGSVPAAGRTRDFYESLCSDNFA